MFSKVIIASEISPVFNDVLEYVKGLRMLGAKECLLVHCLNPYEDNMKISNFYLPLFKENLENQKKILEEAGYKVGTRIVTGFVKKEINKIAVEEDFDLIVVPAAEHSVGGVVFDGGLGHEVVHKASKPVMIVRISDNNRKIPDKTKQSDIAEHILFVTDFSKNADIAFDFIRKMALCYTREVSIIHVQDQSKNLEHRLEEIEGFDKDKLQELKEELSFDITEELRLQELKEELLLNKIDELRLHHLKEELLKIGVIDVHTNLLFGSPTEEIIKFSELCHAPLIVMGSQGRGYLKEVFLGSVSHNLARCSSASILIIPDNRGNW